jgi:hypothetical protein
MTASLAYADNLELYPTDGKAARHLAPLFGKMCREFVSWHTQNRYKWSTFSTAAATGNATGSMPWPRTSLSVNYRSIFEFAVTETLSP